MDRKVGLSIVRLQNVYGDRRALEIAKEIGADAVDFNLDNKDYRNPDCIYSKGDEAVIEYYKGLKAYADELGLMISQTHGKLPGFINNKEEDDALVENSRLDCLATAVLGAPVCVIHNASSISMGANPDPELMHRLSFDMFTRILPYAKEYGVKVATETFGDAVEYESCDFFGNIDEFMKAYEDIKAIEEYRDYFTVCVDTGHSNKAMRYNNPTPGDVIRRIGSDIDVLHLNDNDTLTDQHKMPMTGCIDWDDIFDALDEVGYKGVYNMEVKLAHFGDDFLIEHAEFAVKLMKYMLKKRYK
ncbi:MAG: sugar phosphate isomerase/epimerase [Tyzzerella sp.]|nr:sugar phosphate isomerase/epimerase [Tyzzerella sp.]